MTEYKVVLRYTTITTVLLSGLIAILGLISYLPGYQLFGSVREDYYQIAPSTSLSFVILNIIILNILFRDKIWFNRKILYFLGLLIISFGMLEVLGFYLDMELNFEDFLIPSSGNLNGIPIGRMSPSTGFLFFLTGIAVVILINLNMTKKDTPFRFQDYSGILGTLTLFVSFIFLLAYLYGTPLLYNQASVVPMALTTSIGFLMLSLAIISISNPFSIPLKYFIANNTQSKLFIIFLPINFLAILAGSFALTLAYSVTNINPAFISAIIIGLFLVITVIVVNWITRKAGKTIDQMEKVLKIGNSVWEWNVLTGKVKFDDLWPLILGYNSEDKFVNLDNWKFNVATKNLPGFEEAFQDYLEGRKEFFEFEYRIKTKSENWKWIWVRGLCIEWNDKKEPIRFLGTRSDISEKKIIELKTIDKYIEYEKLQIQFVSNVSHELRTPITGIILSINNLKKYNAEINENQRNEIIEAIIWNSTVLQKMIEDLLLISNIESGKKIKFNFQEIDLHQQIEDVFFQLKPKYSEKNQILINNISKDFKLNADPNKLEQVFRIIIDNSIKYSNEGKTIIVEGKSLYKGKYNENNVKGVLISIIDEGIGIKKIDVNYIFDRFYRATETNEIVGTGLGLSIAKEIIKKHDGQIFAESEYAKGTSIHIFLPERI